MENNIAFLYKEFSQTLIYVIKARIYPGCPKDYIYDCLNDVFTIAIQKQNEPAFLANPEGWLIITARYVVDNFNKKHYNHSSILDPTYDTEAIPQKNMDLIENYICKDFLNNAFRKFFKESLSKDEKYLYYLRYSEHRDLTQISEVLHITPNAVNTRLCRLRAKIKEFIHKNLS
jgi:RNA polymerase sigma factor (sigma-70 family)